MKRYFLITGQIPGQKKSTLVLFEETQEMARAEFKRIIWSNTDLRYKDIMAEYGVDLMISQVFSSTSKIQPEKFDAY